MQQDPVDYNPIAANYALHRSAHPGVVRNLLEVAELSVTSRVLEVGCGTGNYIAELRTLAGCACWSIDPSPEMLAFAGSQPKCAGVIFSAGSGEALDFPPNSFDLIYSVDVVHHLENRTAYFGNAMRALKPGGYLCTVTEFPEELRTRHPTSTYFPDTVSVELTRYPSIELLRQELVSTGFRSVTERHAEAASILNDAEPYKAKVFSSLLFIPESAFIQGLARLEQDLRHGPIHGVSRRTLLWAMV